MGCRLEWDVGWNGMLVGMGCRLEWDGMYAGIRCRLEWVVGWNGM